MKIHILQDRATTQQITEMLEELKSVIKVAVDVERGIVSGGGEWHADCEAELIKAGSRQEDIWGANWYPEANNIEFEALINIRPKQNNRSMIIQETRIRTRLEAIVRRIFEGK